MVEQLRFTKMHGLGNDFILIDGIHQKAELSTAAIQQLSDHHCGVGFNQLLLIEKSKNADFACRIFNSDGSEAEQCGNGMRCVGRFIHEEKLSQKKSLHIETKSGIVTVNIHDYDNIEVNMGPPIFDPSKIPFSVKIFQLLYPIHIDAVGTENIAVLSMGNPHAIFFVESFEQYPINTIGSMLAKHVLFPQGVNVGFVKIVNREHIRLHTYERGVGETLACGSNACAAVVAGIINHKLDDKVNVELSLGKLVIEWKGEGHSVIMSGPASRVFTGVLAKDEFSVMV